jgi:glycosyltransferase involved in cell wall biosynthesis
MGAVARLDTQKRLDRLLRAAARLPGVHCIVAGDGEEREALAALAAELGLAGRVHLLGHRDDPGDVLAAMDVFVVSSDREGLSSSMLEALACGLPVVSTPVSGADDALEPLADGSAPGEIVGFSENAIAAAVGALLADPIRRREMGQAARRRVAERFGMEPMLDAWETLLAGGGG